MDNIILGDVKIALSEWPARLQNLAPRYSKPLEPALSRRNKRPTPDDKRSVATVTGQHSTQQAAEDPNQKDKIESPPSPKLSNTKFSTTNGHTIYYDGEAQTTLFQCYEMINGVGRVLAKGLRVSKKRGFSAAAAALCRYSDGEEPGEDEQKAEKKRRKGELQKQTEETLEFLNSRLKGAAKGCQDTAFRWLKGEDCSEHVDLIVGKIGEMVGRINSEIAKSPQLEANIERVLL